MVDPLPLAALRVRPSRPSDVAGIGAIYAHAVRHGTGTFEIEAPTDEEMARRRDEVLARGWPWLVAEEHGALVGYAYATPFRPRPAYRFCVEDSIYLRPDAAGRGIGRILLAELLARCAAAGARQAIAVIGDSANAASVALHHSLGFAPCGTLAAAGWKSDRWLDVVLMQRALGCGSAAPPAR